MCMKWFCGGPLTPEEGLDLLSPVRRALMVAVQTFITGPQREPTVRSGKEEAAGLSLERGGTQLRGGDAPLATASNIVILDL